MKNIQKTLLIATIFVSYSIVQAQGLIFTEVDTDKNGSISEQEFNKAKADHIAANAKEGRQMRGLKNSPTFATIDINNDGTLSPEEIQKMQSNRRMNRRGKGMGQGNRGMGRPAQPTFAHFDLNGDGSISEQELYNARNKRIAEKAKEGRQMRGLANIASFSEIDKDRDGKIIQGEFDSYLAEHIQQGMRNQTKKN